MKGFKRCSNGHFYKESIDSCPHCASSGGGNPDLDKTAVNPGGGAGGLDKTQVFERGTASGDKTQVFGAGTSDATEVFGKGATPSDEVRDLNKTYIGGVTEESDDGDSQVSAPRATRKITGWIISYTMDDMGVDYRIREGKNRIGKSPESEITISTDSTVSADHAIILYRDGVWYLEDEMSANGTFVNGEALKPRNPTEIKDGDDIRVGSTTFKFKTTT
jgi:hypothetical protein